MVSRGVSITVTNIFQAPTICHEYFYIAHSSFRTRSWDGHSNFLSCQESWSTEKFCNLLKVTPLRRQNLAFGPRKSGFGDHTFCHWAVHGPIMTHSASFSAYSFAAPHAPPHLGTSNLTFVYFSLSMDMRTPNNLGPCFSNCVPWSTTSVAVTC